MLTSSRSNHDSEAPGSFPPRRIPRLRWLLPVVLLGFFGAREAFALSDEDKRTVDYLVKELRYYDTATRFLGSLKAGRVSRDCEAEVDARLIEILRAQGRKDEARRAQEEFKRKYPDHSRSALGSLQEIGDALEDDVLPRLEKASIEAEASKRRSLLTDASRFFAARVRKPLGVLIDDLNKRAGDDDQVRFRRNRAELSRIRFLLLYAGFLPERSKTKREVLRYGFKLATSFVEERDRFYVMQYEGLIQKGLFLLELGRPGDAAEELFVLFDITPPLDPPYDAATVKAFRSLRLRSVLFGARGYNRAGEYNQARKIVENFVYRLPESDPFHFQNSASDPDVRENWTLLELEYAAALAGSGQPKRGLDIIHGVIEKNRGERLVNDARQALGAIAFSGAVSLSGRDYYEAGIGLKSELKFERALELFQKALVRLASTDVQEYAPRCLNEIGEVNYLLERYAESALAYQDICDYFASSSLISKAAQNFLGAATRAQSANASHGGLAALQSEARRIYDLRGPDGFGTLQATMLEASRKMGEESYAEARELYRQIPRESKGQAVPFYWRAHLSAWWMVLLEWDALRARAAGETPEGAALDEASRERLESLASELGDALSEIEKSVASALEDRDLLGAAVGSLTLGQARYNREEWSAARAALGIFLDELAGDDFVRCIALYYLALAGKNLDDNAVVSSSFEALSEACESEPALAQASYALSDHYSERGAEEKAAVYMMIYAAHPTSKSDLEGLPLVMKVVQVLIEGGLIDESQEYIQRAKQLEPGSADLGRRLLYMEGQALAKKKNYRQVIRVLESYVEQYKATGLEYEDPYVWELLGDAYYRVDGKERLPKSLVLAERCYDFARSIVHGRIRGKEKSKDYREYWSLSYRWLRVKYLLGTDAGYKEIVLFVKESKSTDMGGRKKSFLKLAERARVELKQRGLGDMS
ncbi:MAG: hypothetical protein O7J95_07140 [Planctomycetota bacterium]|nr:hypothetical protein [Planctomycetota bacterium]